MHKLVVWTGPVLVEQMAQRLRDAGVQVDAVGVENLYLQHDGGDPYGAAWNVNVALMQKFGSDFGLKPVPR